MWIALYGEKGTSGVHKLECPNNFKRGQTDYFGIETVDLGELKKIRIGHDNKGFTPGEPICCPRYICNMCICLQHAFLSIYLSIYLSIN